LRNGVAKKQGKKREDLYTKKRGKRKERLKPVGDLGWKDNNILLRSKNKREKEKNLITTIRLKDKGLKGQKENSAKRGKRGGRNSARVKGEGTSKVGEKILRTRGQNAAVKISVQAGQKGKGRRNLRA